MEQMADSEISIGRKVVFIRPLKTKDVLAVDGRIYGQAAAARNAFAERFCQLEPVSARLRESQLASFLFDAEREPTAAVRDGLLEIQRGRCFYCDALTRGAI